MPDHAKRRKTPVDQRADTAEMVRRICDLAHLCRRQAVSRHELAERWAVTPRQVNYTLQNARAWLGVVVEHRDGPDTGYVLVDPGVLNLARITPS